MLSLLLALAAAAPTDVAHSGRLIDAVGQPISGPHTVSFSLYSASSGGRPLWTQTSQLTLEDGYFSVMLSGLEAEDFADGGRYLGVSVDEADELLPRAAMVAVPYAITATNAVGGRVRLAQGAPPSCTTELAGELSWDGSALALCDGERWAPIRLAGQDGSTAERAAVDCGEIHADYPSLPTDDYWINPDGLGEAFQVRCDMSQDGGGWIRVDMADDDAIIVLSESSGNSYTKCTHIDPLGNYSFISGASNGYVDAYIGAGAATLSVPFNNPVTGEPFVVADLNEIRQHISTLAPLTRMAITTCDCDYGDSDHDIILTDILGNQFTATRGDCYSRDNGNARYLLHTSAALTSVDGSHQGDLPLPLSPTMLLPDRLSTPSGGSGGGMVFGYQQPYVLVR